MLGLISLGPQGDAEAQERRAELVPGSASEVLGAALSEGFQESIGPRIGRVVSRGYVDQGGGTYAPLNAFDENEQPTGLLPPSPMVPLDTLKREYEIPGVLSFDKDTPQSVAQSLYDHKRDQMARQDAIRRADNMLTQGMAARFAASMVGSLADPVNIAAMFVPGLNEAAVARMAGVAAGAGAMARAGVRAGAGATQGAAGMLALEPLNYLLMGQERDDWTMAGALANVLFGTVAGAGFHSGLGALAERSRGLPDWAPARLANERLQSAPPEVQEAVARAAVAATVEGRPVDVASLMELHDSLAGDDVVMRLYRGEGGGVAGLPGDAAFQDSAMTGGWFTTDIDKARRYGDVSYVDVTRKDLMSFAQGHGGPDEWVTSDPRFRSSAKSLSDALAAERTERQFAEIERQLDEATSPSQIMQAMETARAPDPRAAEPPAPTSRTDLPPPDPKPPGDGAVAKDIAEIEKQVGALDAAIKMQEPTTPKPLEGTVRLYHGASGIGPTEGGGRWVSADPKYAAGYAAKGAHNKVYYIDLPESHPLVQENTNTSSVEGTGMKAPINHFEVPEAMAEKMREFVDKDGPVAAQIKEFDTAVDEEIKVDRALFEAAAACIVRAR